MPSITIHSDNTEALHQFANLVQLFDFKVIKTDIPVAKKLQKLANLPITYAAKKANPFAMAGIWKNKNITQAELRQKAWGDRL